LNLQGKQAILSLPMKEWTSAEVLNAQQVVRVVKATERYCVNRRMDVLRDEELIIAQEQIKKLETENRKVREALIEEKKKNAAAVGSHKAKDGPAVKSGTSDQDAKKQMLDHYIKLQTEAVDKFLALGMTSEDIAVVVSLYQSVMHKV
jgi:hypothetical protein